MIPAIERVGGAPVVIKLIEGTQGIGVLLAESMKTRNPLSSFCRAKNRTCWFKSSLRKAKARTFARSLSGDRVVAAMRRTAEGQEFRSNVHRGGTAEAVELTDEYRETAVRSAQILGLASRRRRHARRRKGPAGHGSQFVTGIGRHRKLYGIGCRWCSDRLHFGASGLSRNRHQATFDRQQRLRRHRNLCTRGIQFRRLDNPRD